MDYRELKPRNLYSYAFGTKEEKTVIESIDGFKLSFDGSSVIYLKDGKPGIISADEENSKGSSLALSGLKMNIDPKKE